MKYRRMWGDEDTEKLIALWPNRSITVKQIAKILGFSNARTVLRKASELELPSRREIPGLVGSRSPGRVAEVVFADDDFDMDAVIIPTLSGARFACSVCGMRSETPVHKLCESRNNA